MKAMKFAAYAVVFAAALAVVQVLASPNPADVSAVKKRQSQAVFTVLQTVFFLEEVVCYLLGLVTTGCPPGFAVLTPVYVLESVLCTLLGIVGGCPTQINQIFAGIPDLVASVNACTQLGICQFVCSSSADSGPGGPVFSISVTDICSVVPGGCSPEETFLLNNLPGLTNTINNCITAGDCSYSCD